MPIYEWRCADGGHVFEEIASISDSNRRKRCPSCGGRSDRLISTFAIREVAPALSASQKQSIAGDDVTKLKLPNYARMCGMDDYSATRLAAHKLGRGAEFEDKMAARAQEKVSRGEPAVKPKPPGKAKHSHAHRHK
jgi:putative FmdB family regulatory protein